MITSICVSNYRSLGENVTLRLGGKRPTVLVGQNGAGKSNLVDVFRFVSESLRNGLDSAVAARGGIGALRRWGYGRPYNLSIRIDVRNEAGEGSWLLELSGRSKGDYSVRREHARFGKVVTESEYLVEDGRLLKGPPGLVPKPEKWAATLPAVAGDKRFAPLADELRNVAIYSVYPDTLGQPQKPDPMWPMDETGKNWCSILREMARNKGLAELVSALAQLTGDIDDCRVKHVGNYLFTEFRHGLISQPQTLKPRYRWFNAGQESDGTLRVAGILTALYQRPSPGLVGVEEPELTVHPGALPLLAEHLLDAANDCQVVVTTHSPGLLELFDADDIRVVERKDGTTTVSRLHEEQTELVKARLLSLGELLNTEGLRSGVADAIEEPPGKEESVGCRADS